MGKDVLKKIIKTATIKSIIDYSDRQIKNKKKRTFQILDLLMPKERKIRSIVGGLETSMGRTLWEPLAKEIARGNQFSVVNKNLDTPTNMPGSLLKVIENIKESRERNNGLYNATTSHEEIKKNCQQFIVTPISTFQKAPKGFGVDIWLQKDGIDYFFDTKTVQPNIGSYNKFLSQILNWYAYYYSKNPNGKAIARIVFPYNPHNGDFWINTKGGGEPIEKKNEAWVENEFWDFISGYVGTFELIKECFKEVYDEGTLEEKLNIIFERNAENIELTPDQVRG